MSAITSASNRSVGVGFMSGTKAPLVARSGGHGPRHRPGHPAARAGVQAGGGGRGSAPSYLGRLTASCQEPIFQP